MDRNVPLTFLPTRKIPSEPHPLPSLSSDEESFVVLGHSLSDSDAESAQSDEVFEHVTAEVIDEAKRLLGQELSALERMSLSSSDAKACSMDGAGASSSAAGGSPDQVDEEPEGSQTPKVASLEQSTMNLPEMPAVDASFKTSEDTLSNVNFSQSLDWHPAEVQQQISMIIEENIHLKDVLKQNNSSMRSQIARVVAWQEDVQKVHEAHKQKLVEAKGLVDKLKHDNEVLTQQKEGFQHILAGRTQELTDLEKYIHENNLRHRQPVVPKSDLEAAYTRTRELEATVLKLNEEYDELLAENLRLKASESKLDKKAKELEETVKKVYAENDALTADNLRLKESQSKLASADKKAKELEETVNKVYAENDALMADNLRLKASESKSSGGDENVKGLEAIIKKLYEENDELMAEISTLKERVYLLSDADQHVAEMEAAVKTLIAENSEANASMVKMEEIHTRELKEAADKMKSLQSDYDSLRTSTAQNIEGLETDKRELEQKLSQSERELCRARDHFRKLETVLAQTEQSRGAAYQETANANRQMEAMRAENGKLNGVLLKQQAALKHRAAEVDELFALKTQLEVFKSDFDAEKNAKEVMKNEKERLVEDLQNLQRRNQQLQEEIELIREHRDYVVYPSNRRSPRAPTEDNASGYSGNDYVKKCPKCSFGFHSQQALENHVYRCIELDDQLP